MSETFCIPGEQQEVSEVPPGVLNLMILIGERRGRLSCMRTPKSQVPEVEGLELGESSPLRSGQKAVRFGWGMGK